MAKDFEYLTGRAIIYLSLEIQGRCEKVGDERHEKRWISFRKSLVNKTPSETLGILYAPYIEGNCPFGDVNRLVPAVYITVLDKFEVPTAYNLWQFFKSPAVATPPQIENWVDGLARLCARQMGLLTIDVQIPDEVQKIMGKDMKSLSQRLFEMFGDMNFAHLRKPGRHGIEMLLENLTMKHFPESGVNGISNMGEKTLRVVRGANIEPDSGNPPK